jgi:hypothetical protein
MAQKTSEELERTAPATKRESTLGDLGGRLREGSAARTLSHYGRDPSLAPSFSLVCCLLEHAARLTCISGEGVLTAGALPVLLTA